MTRWIALLLAAMVCSACDPAAYAARRDASALGPYAPLARFYGALAELQAGRRHGVAVLQVGDSHTANDGFSGRLRELMQDRFGDGGRGMLPPGIPYRYYKPAVVHVASDGWDPRRAGSAPGPFGFAGLRQHTSTDGVMTIEAAPPDLTRVSIDILAQPGGGTLEIATSNGRTRAVTTAAPVLATLRIGAPTDAATTSITLHARGDGPVDLLSWTVERATPGVTWSNLGTIGATVDVMAAWDPAVLRREAAVLQPALIVLAFGTNEGFKDTTDLAAYPAQFRAALHLLQQAAPGAAILVAGPPDGVRANLGTSCPGGGWVVPPNLPRIRRIERDAALSAHAFFWDWAEAMGGTCSIVAWADTDPPLAARDHVHLLQPGQRQAAEALFATLMQGYDRYRAAAGPR